MQGLDAVTLRTQKLIAAARSGLKASVPEAAQILVEEAKLLVPVDTGALRDAIHQEPLVDEPEKQIVLVAPCYEDLSEKVGFRPPYARRIEFGFVGADSLGRVYNQAPKPYMRPAWDGKQAEIKAAIKEGVYAEVDAAMGNR